MLILFSAVVISVSSWTDTLQVLIIRDALPSAKEEIQSLNFATVHFRVAHLPLEALSLLNLPITNVHEECNMYLQCQHALQY